MAKTPLIVRLADCVRQIERAMDYRQKRRPSVQAAKLALYRLQAQHAAHGALTGALSVVGVPPELAFSVERALAQYTQGESDEVQRSRFKTLVAHVFDAERQARRNNYFAGERRVPAAPPGEGAEG